VVQQESKKEAMGPNAFKSNCVCDAGATEEGQPESDCHEGEDIRICPRRRGRGAHSDEFLTQWKQGLKMLEDWLDNPEPKDGFQKTIMQIAGEEHST
jgi:hypothetical protein